ISKAMNDGRFQTALDLAKKLHRQEATPGHRDLLFRCYLGRAKELQERGAFRDAVTVLENTMPLAENDAQKQVQMAEVFLLCGETLRALKVVEGLPEPKPTANLLAIAADVALQRGARGRELLPESLRTDFDLIVSAFDQLAAGEDKRAREFLHGIGLQSPFLEWKVLLRGLSAYYQQVDARAIEQWSRLDPKRLPARMAAALRFRIDAEFARSQPPKIQQHLRQKAD